MLAVHLENNRVQLRRVPKPRRREGYSLIRLLTAGICNTDLELLRGYYRFRGRPGHEFIGEVVESDTPALRGKRVAGEINLHCNLCDWCRRGLGRHCPNRTVLGILGHPGAFAEFLTLPDRNLHPIPSSIPTHHAVFIEPLAAACEILDQAAIAPGSSVAVLGDGKLGLLIAQVLHVHGAAVCLYGRHPDKLNIARQAGITGSLLPRKIPKAEFDFAVDATGSAAGLSAATTMVRARGTVIMKSTIHDAVCLNTAPLIVNEITLIGSRCGRFQPALRLLRAEKIRLDPLISDTFPIDQAPGAFARAAESGVLKVLLQP